MKSHELARLLLTLPDLPVATEANNHTQVGVAHVGTLNHYSGQFLIIGGLSRRLLNYPNWYVSELHRGEAPNNWWSPSHPEAKPYAGKTRDFDDWYEREKAAGPVKRRVLRLILRKDGIDRYNSGLDAGWSAQVDARGGEPEPQFGGKWAGFAWNCDNGQSVETTRSYETPGEALSALNAILSPHDVLVVREEPF